MHQRYALLNVDLPVEKLRQQKIRLAMRAAGWIFGLAAVFLAVWYGVTWVMKAGFSQNEFHPLMKEARKAGSAIQADFGNLPAP